jgi:hypothetical protein
MVIFVRLSAKSSQLVLEGEAPLVVVVVVAVDENDRLETR